MDRIAFRIKKLRELKNLTQESMANRLGISQNTYSRIETESSRLSTARLMEISDILEVPVNVILNAEEPIYDFKNKTKNGEKTVNLSNHFESHLDCREQVEFWKSEVVRIRTECETLLEIIKNLTLSNENRPKI
jgi:transcriptional regulator with XRE-family HTH domain